MGGTGMLLVETWIFKVVEIEHMSDPILLLKLIIGKSVFTFLSIYAPQHGLSEVTMQLFYNQLQDAHTKIP